MTRTFDERATTWDAEPRRPQLAADIFAAVERRIPLRPDWIALDYGAGTGLLTLPLAPLVRRILAVDSSAGMLDVLSQKARAAGLANVDLLRADFTADPLPPGPFALVASAMTLHHVVDVDLLLGTFFALLSPGGHLALADLDAEDGSFHGVNALIPHRGFDRDVFSNQLAAAGFRGMRLETAARTPKNGRTYPVFLATAHKPQSPPFPPHPPTITVN